jgi:hypothetical protein
MNIRNRVKELRYEKASELKANPKNWRTHGDRQKLAMNGLLSEIGFAGAVIARELEDGSLMLIDGHLRQETAGDQEVPVLVLDVDEQEADRLLLTFDPLKEMASTDYAALESLLSEVKTNESHVADLFEKLQDTIPQPEDFEDVEDEDVDYQDMDGIRMIQLFLSDSAREGFFMQADALSSVYETDNMTDTITEAMRRELGEA